jgi:hypothetical protein
MAEKQSEFVRSGFGMGLFVLNGQDLYIRNLEFPHETHNLKNRFTNRGLQIRTFLKRRGLLRREITHIDSHGLSMIIIWSWLLTLAEREIFTFLAYVTKLFSFFYKM